jgi:hypothetical protein
MNATIRHDSEKGKQDTSTKKWVRLQKQKVELLSVEVCKELIYLPRKKFQMGQHFQPEVAGEIACRRHILRTLHYVYKHPIK